MALKIGSSAGVLTLLGLLFVLSAGSYADQSRWEYGEISLDQRRAELNEALANPEEWQAQMQPPPRLKAEDEIFSLSRVDISPQEFFDAFSAATQIKFVFDDKVDMEWPVSIEIEKLTVLEALRLVAVAHGYMFVIRDAQTVFIAHDTRQKRQMYMPEETRVFRLKHADPTNVVTALRVLLQGRFVFTDESNCVIAIRDTLGRLDIAAELIEQLDVAADAKIKPRLIWYGTDSNQDMRSPGAEVPGLTTELSQPVDIDLSDTNLCQLYDRLGEAMGIHFVFGSRLPCDAPVLLERPATSAGQLLDELSREHGLFHSVWTPGIVVVAPDDRSRRSRLDQLAIELFDLNNADPRVVITELRTELGSRQLVEMPRLRAVAMKDTLANLAAARQIVERLDRGR